MDIIPINRGGKGKSENRSKENNFNIIRFLAALFVFGGHMGMILGGAAPTLGSYGLHELGVGILFLIGGYLITKSWLADSNYLRFLIRRFLRLWPPFAVLVLIMVFVTGPLLSEYGREGYFQSWYRAFLDNLRFYTVYAQPGVFTSLPIPNTTNGSLWTMPVEACLYLITPLILTLFRVRRRSRGSFWGMALVTGAAIVFDLYLRTGYTGGAVVFYGTDWIAAYHLMVFYLVGMLFTYEEMRKLLNIQAACAAISLLFLLQRTTVTLQYFLFYTVLPYFVFSFAFAPKPFFGRFGHRAELSYGIYLYGFFFQQLIVWYQLQDGLTLNYGEAFLLSLLPTMAAAALSYFLIEVPTLRLSRYLTRKLRCTPKDMQKN